MHARRATLSGAPRVVKPDDSINPRTERACQVSPALPHPLACIRGQPYYLDDWSMGLPFRLGSFGSGSTAPSGEPCQAEQTGQAPQARIAAIVVRLDVLHIGNWGIILHLGRRWHGQGHEQEAHSAHARLY